MRKRLRGSKILFLISSLFYVSAVAQTQAQANHNAELVVPVFEASQIISPVIIPAISIYRIWNPTGGRGLVETALPAGATFDPSYISPDNLPTCIFPGQILDPDKSCMVKLIISQPVQNGRFYVQMGTALATVPINVSVLPNPTYSLSVTPNLINLSPGRTADLFVSNPTSGFVANNVKVILPAPLAERVAKVAHSGCDWLPAGSVCKVTLMAKADIATPAVGWIRVAASNTRIQTVAIQIGASG
jgi:hypothetical protein